MKSGIEITFSERRRRRRRWMFIDKKIFWKWFYFWAAGSLAATIKIFAFSFCEYLKRYQNYKQQQIKQLLLWNIYCKKKSSSCEDTENNMIEWNGPSSRGSILTQHVFPACRILDSEHDWYGFWFSLFISLFLEILWMIRALQIR